MDDENAEVRAGDDLDAVLKRAFPDGLNDQDSLAVARLPTSSRERLRRRLVAILDWTEPLRKEDRPAGAPEAAMAAGLGVSQFHALVARWRRKRAISTLGVHAGERKRRASGIDAHARERVKAAARELLEQHPDLGSGAIRKRLIDNIDDLPSPPTILRLIDETRREMPPGRFGCGLVLDSAGLDLLDPEGLRMRLHVVLDDGTALVLGWALVTDRSMSLGHVRAADDALGRLGSLDLERFEICGSGPSVDVRFAPTDVAGQQVFSDALAFSSRVRREADHVLGRAAVRTIGERLDGLALGTNWREEGVSFRGSRTSFPTISALVAQGIDVALERHNARRRELAAGNRQCLGGDAVQAISRTRLRLQEIVELERCLLADPAYAWARAGVQESL